MEDNSRIISGFASDTEKQRDAALRPKTLLEYIGQAKVKEKMEIFISAAKQTG